MRQAPTERQQHFLLHADAPEVLYGGAAGGGKSSALLMAALQYATVPGYAAMLLRRTYADLALPGALIPRSHQWLAGTGAAWNEQRKTWTFPGGAMLQFAYCETPNDVYRYQGSEFQFVGIDELTQWPEDPYRYLFSRLRRLAGSDVPIRMRAGTNPGGIGHEWVKRRFISHPDPGRVFVPAKLDDNPHLDREEYRASLLKLDPITRAQLLAGDWDAYATGRFRREWFRRYYGRGPDDGPADTWMLDDGSRAVRVPECAVFITVDPAATAKAAAKKTSDYTAIGVFSVVPSGELLVLEMVRERMALDAIVPRVARACRRWRPQWVGLESVGFQAGLALDAGKHPDIRAVVVELKPEGKDKLVRATPAILLAEQGKLYLPESAPWLEDFEAELRQFTGDPKQDAHDDQVDVLAYAVLMKQQHYYAGDDEPMVLNRGRR